MKILNLKIGFLFLYFFDLEWIVILEKIIVFFVFMGFMVGLRIKCVEDRLIGEK